MCNIFEMNVALLFIHVETIVSSQGIWLVLHLIQFPSSFIMLIMAVHGGDINQEHIIDYIISIFCFDFVHFFVASLSDWWYRLTSENDELLK